ncbi:MULTISPECIES: hypothetical protein [Clostridium]|uniref:hypothetical protein n=1 Tax=Clostridium TaxID=1485 RepID=UPI0008264E75|nr:MULTISPECIES: hypothetical protein [Clostridium]PJI10205.1 hypothetical protein CUB90_21040 [Clostridium sp. CT7]
MGNGTITSLDDYNTLSKAASHWKWQLLKQKNISEDKFNGEMAVTLMENGDKKGKKEIEAMYDNVAKAITIYI